MPSFIPTQGAATQVINVTDQAQVVQLSKDSPNFYMVADSDTILFARWGVGLTAGEADMPIPPGSFGTQRRGNADSLAIRAQTGKTATVYITPCTEF